MTAQTILPANTLSSGYDVDNSIRFNSGDSAQMNKTLGTATDVDKYTISMWVKRARLGHRQMMMRVINPSSTSTYAFLEFQAGDSIGTNDYNGSSDGIAKITNAKFRDPSAWMHIVLALDSTQGTGSDRSKLYVNGTQITSFSTDTDGTQNQNLMGNTSGKNIYIGGDGGQDTRYCGLYMAEVVFIDGQQLDATSFGEFDEDSGIWKPIDVSGLTFGNNGFYLDFKDSSNLGNDANGGTDLTEVNIAATDQSTDTCTNNFTTLNPLHKDNLTLSEGNLTGSNSSSSVWNRASGTIAVTSGKWYAEFKMTTQEASQVGVIEINRASLSTTDQPRTDVSCYAYKDNGQKGNNNSDSNYGATYTDGDIIAIALDLDNHKIYFSKNGTFQNSGDPTTGATGTGSAFDLSTAYTYTFIAAVYDSSGNGKIESNFGGTQSFTVSSGNTDGNGYGNFEYAVPSGYYSLNTKNLAEYG